MISITEWGRRMTELEDMRLAVKFGKKDEYSDWEIETVCEELSLVGLNAEESDLDAVEALFKKLNDADEAARARSS
jgi:hypothetical protein